MIDVKVFVGAVQTEDNCKVCDTFTSLRNGCCAHCAHKISGCRISPSEYKLWENKNPDNYWYVEVE